jgi:hypothetical protein
MVAEEVGSRKTCGALYTGEKGGDEDGIEGVVGEAAELWSERDEWLLIHDMCLSRTTMVSMSRVWGLKRREEYVAIVRRFYRRMARSSGRRV